jgi:glutamate/aspartate transport system substrate-binding protein
MKAATLAFLCAWIALSCGYARGADEEAPLELSGTLLSVKRSGVVTIAYRDSSIPFSYLSKRGEPIGYSIELCRRLVDAMSEAVGRELAIRWLAVTPSTRIAAIASGRANLECGSTTRNLERAREVAFSPVIFVSGTKLLVRRGSEIGSFRDLKGKSVAVTAGTTNAQAMRDLQARFATGFRLAPFPTHAESFARLESGEVDAFATDEVLLLGLVASSARPRDFEVVGEFLSYEPYAIMYRKDDPQMKRLVEATFRDLAADGEIDRQYRRWFMSRLPSGVTLGLPMSPQLRGLVRAMSAGEE